MWYFYCYNGSVQWEASLQWLVASSGQIVDNIATKSLFVRILGPCILNTYYTCYFFYWKWKPRHRSLPISTPIELHPVIQCIWYIASWEVTIFWDDHFIALRRVLAIRVLLPDHRKPGIPPDPRRGDLPGDRLQSANPVLRDRASDNGSGMWYCCQL